jgi:glutaredoxin-related protein
MCGFSNRAVQVCVHVCVCRALVGVRTSKLATAPCRCLYVRMRVRVNGQRACVRLPAEVNKRAVQILDHHKTAYGAFNVLEDQDVREGVKAYSCVPLPACTHARTRAHTHTHAQRAVGGLLICTPPRPVRHSCVAASSTPVLANLAGCDGLDHDCLT